MTQNKPGSEYTVAVNLKRDGSFSQRIEWKDRSDHQETTGTWKLDGAKVSLEGILMQDFDFATGQGYWTPRSIDWWMADFGSEIRLFGGLHGDPDSFKFFAKDQ